MDGRAEGHGAEGLASRLREDKAEGTGLSGRGSGWAAGEVLTGGGRGAGRRAADPREPGLRREAESGAAAGLGASGSKGAAGRGDARVPLGGEADARAAVRRGPPVSNAGFFADERPRSSCV